jgi:Zn-dependent protease
MFNRGIQVATFSGIPFRIDVSWIIIFLLIVSNLTYGILPSLSPNLFGYHYWLLGILGAGFFFGSILLHELAHALVAKAQGIPVGSITLFLFGGVAHIEEEPKTPAAELLMAGAGPVTSVALAALFWSLGGIVGASTPLGLLLGWLAMINLLLALFNLLPGFPLDGGRIFRSIVWAVTGNFDVSTMVASFSGRMLGYLFIGLGIMMVLGVSVPVLGTGLISGLWILFIGLFLSQAALQAYQTQEIHRLLADVPIKEVMRKSLLTLDPNDTLHFVMNHQVKQSKESLFPVAVDDNLLGTVTLEKLTSVPRKEWPSRRVSDVMTSSTKVKTLDPTDEAASALTLLRAEQEEVPVVADDNRLLGMISWRDIGLWLSMKHGLESMAHVGGEER